MAFNIYLKALFYNNNKRYFTSAKNAPHGVPWGKKEDEPIGSVLI